MIKKLFILIILWFLIINFSYGIDLSWCYEKTFKVSAYYSPIYKQKFYYKWNYYEEKKLNWEWIRWASWKKVFNGMIAASKDYEFWTKIYFPWLWVWQVEDRWQAIVSSWKRQEKYDRIDIWVWKWDEALMRALSFWKQVMVWYVCHKKKTIKVWFDYSKFKIYPNFFEKTLWWIGLYVWRKDPWVETLQKYLKQIWYFNYTKITWYFWYETKHAIEKFQKDNNIKTEYYGYFWPKTREIFKEKLRLKQTWSYKKHYTNIILVKSENIKTQNEKNKDQILQDLSILTRWLWKWYNTYEVKILQKYLQKMWYYNWVIDGYYWDETIKAVADFQFKYNIINKSDIYFAWYFWPKTRDVFKKIVIESIVNI